jgi:hypothetical protein
MSSTSKEEPRFFNQTPKGKEGHHTTMPPTRDATKGVTIVSLSQRAKQGLHRFKVHSSFITESNVIVKSQV